MGGVDDGVSIDTEQRAVLGVAHGAGFGGRGGKLRSFGSRNHDTVWSEVDRALESDRATRAGRILHGLRAEGVLEHRRPVDAAPPRLRPVRDLGDDVVNGVTVGRRPFEEREGRSSLFDVEVGAPHELLDASLRSTCGGHRQAYRYGGGCDCGEDVRPPPCFPSCHQPVLPSPAGRTCERYGLHSPVLSVARYTSGRKRWPRSFEQPELSEATSTNCAAR